MSSPVKTALPPPPKPTRHPSRPQLRGSISSSSGGSPNLIQQESPTKSDSSSLASPSRPVMRSRPPSAIYLGTKGSENQRTSTSPNSMGRLGTLNGVPHYPTTLQVGLGSPRLDFRSEWAASSRNHFIDTDSSHPDTSLDISVDDSSDGPPIPPPRSSSRDLRGGKKGLVNDISGLPSPPGTESDSGLRQTQSTLAPVAPKRNSSLSPRPPIRTSSLSPQAPAAMSRTNSSNSSLGQTATDKSRNSLLNGMTRSQVNEVLAISTPTEDLSRSKRSVSAESPNGDLDQRIREAEERIRRTLRTPGSALSPAKTSPSPARSRHSTEPEEYEQKEKSGGSGSGKRKPLPFEFRHAPYTPSPQAATSRSNLYDSPVETPPQPFPSRFATSRQSIPSSPSNNRSPSAAGHVRRQWSESISGLPRRGELDERGLPLPRALMSERKRAESVMETSYRYQSRGNSGESALTERAQGDRQVSRALFPSDSISAVGSIQASITTKSELPRDKKDPLEVLRRIEESRAKHNRQWDERSASVLGDSHSPRRPSSRMGIDYTPNRSTTSMSFRGIPQTEPVRSYRLSGNGNGNGQEVESPTYNRSVSRFEPRHVRSSTSLGGRVGLDVAAHSEHGQLLFDACRSLETKFSETPDLVRTLQAHTKATESVNHTLRMALQLVNRMLIEIETPLNEEMVKLSGLIKEASKGSDQSVRDLTRIMLDLPRGLSIPTMTSASTSAPMSTPVRSGSLRSTMTSNGSRRSIDPGRPSTSMGGESSQSPRVSALSPLGNYGTGRSRFSRQGPSLDLGSIEQSPPESSFRQIQQQQHPSQRRSSGGGSGSGNGIGGAFFPSMSRAGTTTAISTVTAGPAEESPSSNHQNRTRSFSKGHSARSSSLDMDQNGQYEQRNEEIEAEHEPDSIAALERSLAMAAKAREEGQGQGHDQRRVSVGERFLSHLRS